MKLNLTRDLVVLDVEATGLNVIRDRIVQIAMIKVFKNERDPVEFSALVNPGIPISAEAIAVHGINPQDLATKPTFTQLAQVIWDFIGDADLAGYNSNRFDIPILIEEFARAGMDFDISNRRLIDVQRIFYKMEPRTLKAAYRFYCGKELTDAHDALADVRATLEVLQGQIARYEGQDLIDEDGNRIEAPVKNDIQALHDFTNDGSYLDVTHRIRLNAEGTPVFNFGKYIGQPVKEVFARDKNYYHWILEKEFSSQLKQIVKQLMREVEKGQ
ncbi:MAG: 3'-5' exonuclease [Saprospiraceae bacterium]|nr:3'-5' exonuclease [Saprospiraceae bacterium]MDW8484853.1 3'-5' exonuclease [Saprospiraceae bacterium]